MSLNCKPGDLAVIVEAIHPENVGVIVEVIERGPNPELLPYWACRTAGGAKIPMTCAKTGQVSFCDLAWCYDFQLRPIRPAPARTSREAQTTAVA